MTASDIRQRDERDHLMVKKLYAQVSYGDITDNWTEDFVTSLKNRLDAGLALSDKQRKKLEEVFERY